MVKSLRFRVRIARVFVFIFGYKLVGLITAVSSPYFDSQRFIFSMRGSWIGGLIIAIIFVYLRYREDKNALPEPQNASC